MARRPLISGNWKMHLNHLEAIQMVQKLSLLLAEMRRSDVEVSVHPPFTSLRSVQVVVEESDASIHLGAQNCHPAAQGAYTGEISTQMLAKLKVDYVIIGHSERRQLLGETDDFVRAKLDALLASQLTPIVCVGETLAEREAGSTADRVESQVRAAFTGLRPEQAGSVVVAYEPIWAIGTGRNATPEDAQAVCALIRQLVGDLAGSQAAGAVRIQYGGSVKGSNAAEILAQPDVDGALVGGASLDPDEFSQIVGAWPV
jgi:triosephosphate isomerase